ncbi:MAG: hypothetical protein IJW00_08985 [Clostridia bacterium]|nr:hypothetical protein [Clostridia bacterium]
MGFGLMLCGYFILTFMSFGMGDYSFAAYIIGAVVVGNAAYKLKDYCPSFAGLMAVSGLYLLLGAYDVALFLDELFLWGVVPAGQALTSVLDQVCFVTEILMHVMLLISIMRLAKHIEEDKIKARSIRNLVFTGLWAVCQLIFLIFPAVANFQNQIFPKFLTLFVLICYILNALLLHACFRDICPEGEELGPPMKRSRFAFINQLNDKFEERSTKALKETLAYGQQKQKEREEKRKSKNSQRNKK